MTMKRHGSLALVLIAGLLAGLLQSSALDPDAPLRSLATAVTLIGAGVLGWRQPRAERSDANTEAQ